LHYAEASVVIRFNVSAPTPSSSSTSGCSWAYCPIFWTALARAGFGSVLLSVRASSMVRFASRTHAPRGPRVPCHPPAGRIRAPFRITADIILVFSQRSLKVNPSVIARTHGVGRGTWQSRLSGRQAGNDKNLEKAKTPPLIPAWEGGAVGVLVDAQMG